MTQLSRRDILKLMALASASLAARPLASLLDRQADASSPHVIVFVFDAWSAAHMKMYGYHRLTMPNLERFADRCNVYHNHYSTGSFTVPGTASLLTGLQPWEHRAVQLTAGGVAPKHQEHTIFAALEKSHSGAGYAQNPYADLFLYQFRDRLQHHIPRNQFDTTNGMLSSLPIFANDSQIAFASFENNIVRNGKGTSGSLYFGMLSRLQGLSEFAGLRADNIKQYPAGLPLAGGYFLLDQVVDGLIESIRQFQSPTLAYLHVFPPHEPYAPKREFTELFDDGWLPPEKPIHPLSRARNSREESLYNRLRYDQYIASWDAEFARALRYLETSGLLEKSVVIVTSDHGELFERGELGHNTSVLSSPVAHVPLLISLPGQNQRRDFHAVTSSVDILPTVASLAGAEVPAWGDGRLLPGLGGEEDLERPIFSMDAKSASSFTAIRQLSIAMIKQRHRLVYYQYPNYSGFEFYDLDGDPEELEDLFPSAPKLATLMKDELLQTIEDFNRPYQKKK